MKYLYIFPNRTTPLTPWQTSAPTSPIQPQSFNRSSPVQPQSFHRLESKPEPKNVQRIEGKPEPVYRNENFPEQKSENFNFSLGNYEQPKQQKSSGSIIFFKSSHNRALQRMAVDPTHTPIPTIHYKLTLTIFHLKSTDGWFFDRRHLLGAWILEW